MTYVSQLGLSDTLTGGLLAASGTILVAVFGFLATKGSTASNTAQWLVEELREMLSERDAEIERLKEHVEECDKTNEAQGKTIEKQGKHIEAIHKTLRTILTAQQYEDLTKEWN